MFAAQNPHLAATDPYNVNSLHTFQTSQVIQGSVHLVYVLAKLMPFLLIQFQANMHAAFGYDRRDPYSRLPIDTPPHQSSNGGVDPIVDHTVEHNVSILFAHTKKRPF